MIKLNVKVIVSRCQFLQEDYRAGLETVMLSDSLDEIWQASQRIYTFKEHAQHCHECKKLQPVIKEAADKLIKLLQSRKK